jgi:hypothetical protein
MIQRMGFACHVFALPARDNFSGTHYNEAQAGIQCFERRNEKKIFVFNIVRNTGFIYFFDNFICYFRQSKALLF